MVGGEGVALFLLAPEGAAVDEARFLARVLLLEVPQAVERHVLALVACSHGLTKLLLDPNGRRALPIVGVVAGKVVAVGALPPLHPQRVRGRHAPILGRATRNVRLAIPRAQRVVKVGVRIPEGASSPVGVLAFGLVSCARVCLALVHLVPSRARRRRCTAPVDVLCAIRLPEALLEIVVCRRPIAAHARLAWRCAASFASSAPRAASAKWRQVTRLSRAQPLGSRPHPEWMDAAVAYAQLATGRDRAFWIDRAVTCPWKLHTRREPGHTHPPPPGYPHTSPKVSM